MDEQIFHNAPLDKDGNPRKDWRDWFQAKCVVLGSTQQQLDNADWLFEVTYECPGQMPCSYALDYHAPGIIHKSLLHAEKPDAKLLVQDKIKLSEICVRVGFISSKGEFRRKCQQKGIQFDKVVIEQDVELDMNVPDIMHEVRLGKRFMEILIPLKEFKDETEES